MSRTEISAANHRKLKSHSVESIAALINKAHLANYLLAAHGFSAAVLVLNLSTTSGFAVA